VVSTPAVVVVDTAVVSTVRESTTTTVESTAVTVPSDPDPHDVKPTKAIDKIIIIFFILYIVLKYKYIYNKIKKQLLFVK
jgi:hypothetical protein